MPESNIKSSNANSEAEFVLKHRIAGAAFLLFFGALFVPWLLGAPNSQPSANTNLSAETSSSADLQNVGQDLVSALADEDIAGEEQVYISKITPLDANRSKNDAAKSTAKNSPVDAKNLDSLEDDAEVATRSAPQAEPLKGVNRASSGDAKNEVSSTQTKVSSPKSELATGSPTKIESNSDTSATKSTIDVGWMVQVGVFTDKRGANRVVEDLRGKGFSPSTSIVDTNRGKNTGTRIWLGPFAQRVDAAKAKNYLTEKTGEAGFIRAYP